MYFSSRKITISCCVLSKGVEIIVLHYVLVGRCRDLVPMTNQTFECSMGYAVGSVCFFTCSNGYRLRGEERLTCGSSPGGNHGANAIAKRSSTVVQWSSYQPTCESKILSYILILSHLISSYLISSHLVLSYLTLSYLILSYLILSYLILSYLILSYLILSYLILSYLLSSL